MGRPERPLDPQAGPVQRFAFDLRSLREQGGRLSYHELAKRAHYAPTTLSEAAKGEKLPTLEVTRAFVKACGGDQDAWERRWWEVHKQLRLQPPDSGPPAAVATSATVRSSPPRHAASVEKANDGVHRPRRPWLAAAAIAVMVVVMSGGEAQWRAHGVVAATSSRPDLLPLNLLRARQSAGSFVRIWALTTEPARTLQPVSSSGYEMKGKVGDCYANHERGTVPVWHHTYPFNVDGYQQHLYTIETDPRHDKALKWGWTERDPHPLCYVYPIPVPGTEPLYRKREDSRNPSSAIGDGHGHVYTRSRKAFDSQGFKVDQVWYVPVDKRRS